MISCCVYDKNMQEIHDSILYFFDCWADTVVHLVLLKSSMCHQSFDQSNG